jgi:hypothetical protein
MYCYFSIKDWHRAQRKIECWAITRLARRGRRAEEPPRLSSTTHYILEELGRPLITVFMSSCKRVSRRMPVAGHPFCYTNHPCFAAHRPSLFRRVRDRWKTFPFFMGPHVCWPASVSLGAQWCVFRGSVGFLFGELVPSHCRIPCLSGAAYCRPVVFLTGTSPQLRVFSYEYSNKSSHAGCGQQHANTLM